MEVFSSRPEFTCQPLVWVQGAAVPSYICLCVWRGWPKEWGAVEGWNGFVSVAPSTRRILMRIKWGRLISPSAWPELDVHVWILFPSTWFVRWSNLSEQELSRDLSLAPEFPPLLNLHIWVFLCTCEFLRSCAGLCVSAHVFSCYALGLEIIESDAPQILSQSE